MAISSEDIKKIASLSRISLTAEEESRFARELSAVLDYFKRLETIDTSSVDTDRIDLEAGDNLRADISRDSGIQADILGNAPAREDEFFKVRSVL